MKDIKKYLDINPIIIIGLGLGGAFLFASHEDRLSKRITKLSQSLLRFSHIVTENEQERQHYEYRQGIRLETLEDKVNNLCDEIEPDEAFKVLDRTEV